MKTKKFFKLSSLQRNEMNDIKGGKLIGDISYPLYGILPDPLYGIKPLYGINPLYGIEPPVEEKM